LSFIDASITPTPRKPQGQPTYMFSEHPETSPTRELKPGVDQQAQWAKKGGKLQYGYKRHYLSEAQEGLVTAVHTTAANAHDSQHLEACLSEVVLPRGKSCTGRQGLLYAG